MIRFGMKRDEYDDETGFMFFMIYLLYSMIVLLIGGCVYNSYNPSGTVTFLTYFFAITTILYSIGFALIKLYFKLYVNTKFFLIDCIPVVGILMRAFEKFYNIYLLIRRVTNKLKKAYIETNNEEMEYRLNNIAEVNESITKKVKSLKREIDSTKESKATKRLVKDMEVNLNILNRGLG